MTRKIALLAALVAGSCACVSLRAEEFTQAQMNNLVKQLEDAAAAWQDGKTYEGDPDLTLSVLIYDEKSVSFMTAALKAERMDPLNLYVANRLFKPLLKAKSDVILKALPNVSTFVKDFGTYKEFPQYSPEVLKAYRTTAAAGQPPLTAKQVELAQQLQAKKLEKERPIALHNEQVAALQVTFTRVLVAAHTDKTDDQVIAMLQDALEKRQWLYVDIVAAVSEQAEKMNDKRAQKYYDVFAKLATDLRLKKDSYAQPDQAKVQADANTTIPTKVDYPGIRLTKALNVLATSAKDPAKAPAYKVPTEKEVDAAQHGGTPGPTPTRGPRR